MPKRNTGGQKFKYCGKSNETNKVQIHKTSLIRMNHVKRICDKGGRWLTQVRPNHGLFPFL